MGTRCLTAVMSCGEYKIAQYGQWDGNPERGGITVLKFLLSHNMDIFRRKLRNVLFYTEQELTSALAPGDAPVELLRDISTDILMLIYNKRSSPLDKCHKLENRIDFASDAIYCEYGYVIDLDAEVFEVYINAETHRELHQDKITIGRFLLDDAIQLYKTYPLDDLPTVEQFKIDLSEIL